MRIGVVRELKDHEFRVALTPAGAHDLSARGHDVVVESGAGIGSGFDDQAYAAAGARIADATAVWQRSELLLKVKEPVPQEYSLLRRGQVLFAYLHLAASKACTDAVLDSSTTAIAYEQVRAGNGSLPLLAPMSEIAGKLATQAGAYHLTGATGVLLGGVPGVRPAEVVVIGGGVAGANAAAVATGMGARVTVLDTNLARLRELDAQFAGRVHTLMSTALDLEQAVLRADLVIGAVLVPGAAAPKLVDNALVARMRAGAVLVDIAIDQGGCFESSRPTTYSAPTFEVAGTTFYCVANMPGAVPRTSTPALTNATLPYVRTLAESGWRHPDFAGAVVAHEGQLLTPEVAAAHRMSAA